jgi:predicted DNA-binding protein
VNKPTIGKKRGLTKSPNSSGHKLYVSFLGIRLATVTFEEIEAVAERTGQTISAVVRQAIERGLRGIK